MAEKLSMYEVAARLFAIGMDDVADGNPKMALKRFRWALQYVGKMRKSKTRTTLVRDLKRVIAHTEDYV